MQNMLTFSKIEARRWRVIYSRRHICRIDKTLMNVHTYYYLLFVYAQSQ